MSETKTIEVSPGSGWRWLEADEIIEADDEVFIYTQARFIKPTTRLGKPAGGDGDDGFPVRRKIENDWVVQDRVPPREHIDQVSYTVDHDYWVTAQGLWTSIHGSDNGSAGSLKVRCRRKDLPPLPAPPADGQWGVGPAREALEKIAAQYNIDGKNLKSAELGEKISLAMLKDQISELRDCLQRMEQRLNKMEGVMIPQMIIGPGR